MTEKRHKHIKDERIRVTLVYFEQAAQRAKKQWNEFMENFVRDAKQSQGRSVRQS